MYGADAFLKPRVTISEVQDDVFRDQCTFPATVDKYAKDTKCLIAWTFSLSTSLEALDEFDVASFVKGQAARGPSVPRRVRKGLGGEGVWVDFACEACYGFIPCFLFEGNSVRRSSYGSDGDDQAARGHGSGDR